MNIREGLERINTAWWFFWGLLAFIGGAAILFDSRHDVLAAAGVAFGGAAVCVVAHRVMRWILRGFFPLTPSQ